MLVCMPTDLPVHQPTCSFNVSFSFQLTTETNPVILKLSLPVHLDAFLPANHEDQPVKSTICLHAHGSTCPSAYLFILMLSFQPTANIYLVTHL